LSLKNTRMPTVPLVAAQSAIGVRCVNLFGVAGVVAIHAERRHQNRAVDADGVHGCHHLVAGDLRRPVESADPGAARTIAFIGVHLSV
jgi:hypothetical protein